MRELRRQERKTGPAEEKTNKAQQLAWQNWGTDMPRKSKVYMYFAAEQTPGSMNKHNNDNATEFYGMLAQERRQTG